MENFELLLRVVLNETITSEDSKRLCPLWRDKLGNAATMLWANNHNSAETVFEDHTTHLQEVTQAISEQVCWKTILNELLTNETLAENARRQQTTYLKTRLDDTQIKLQEAIETANSHAVLQDQQESAYTNSGRQRRTARQWQ
jgi:hypothetical protein